MGYPVFGNTSVDFPSERRQLLKILEDGIRAADRTDGFDYLCFNPRHGVRVEFDGQTVDFLICFQCGYLVCSESAFDGKTHYKIHAEPILFNGILDSAGIYRDDPAGD